MNIKNIDITSNRIFAYLATATAIILAIPLIAMQFTSEVNWGVEDFIAMGILLFGSGSVFIALARVLPKKYRLLVGIAVTAAFLLTWAHLAVGLVDTWPLAGS